MITVPEAFAKFRSRLELSEKEQSDASRRHNEIRDYLQTKFDIERDFLTGSYKRWTKTKPLKDVDIFCVLGKKERHRRDEPSADLLTAFEDALVEKYGRDKVTRQRRSVTVDFGVRPDENEETDGKVMSFDVVPAFDKEKHYEIADTGNPKGWTETDPEIHADHHRYFNLNFRLDLGLKVEDGGTQWVVDGNFLAENVEADSQSVSSRDLWIFAPTLMPANSDAEFLRQRM